MPCAGRFRGITSQVSVGLRVVLKINHTLRETFFSQLEEILISPGLSKPYLSGYQCCVQSVAKKTSFSPHLHKQNNISSQQPRAKKQTSFTLFCVAGTPNNNTFALQTHEKA